MIALILSMAAFCFVWIFKASREDRFEEYHLLHGPDSGCAECEGK